MITKPKNKTNRWKKREINNTVNRTLTKIALLTILFWHFSINVQSSEDSRGSVSILQYNSNEYVHRFPPSNFGASSTPVHASTCRTRTHVRHQWRNLRHSGADFWMALWQNRSPKADYLIRNGFCSIGICFDWTCTFPPDSNVRVTFNFHDFNMTVLYYGAALAQSEF